MQASMSFPEFIAFAKTKGIAVEKITPTRVYLDLGDVLGMPKPAQPDPDKPVDLWLISRGEKYIGVIKEIRALTGLGLAEAKALGDACPKPVLIAVDLKRAQEGKRALEEAGATAEIRTP